MFDMSYKKENNDDLRYIGKGIEGLRKNAGTSDPNAFNNPVKVRKHGPSVYMWEKA